MPDDSKMTRFLYSILRQKDLKDINWNLVASEQGITNGHAARMRYSRFKSSIEGKVSRPRGVGAGRGTTTPSAAAEARRSAAGRNPRTMKKVKTEQQQQQQQQQQIDSGSGSGSVRIKADPGQTEVADLFPREDSPSPLQYPYQHQHQRQQQPYIKTENGGGCFSVHAGAELGLSSTLSATGAGGGGDGGGDFDGARFPTPQTPTTGHDGFPAPHHQHRHDVSTRAAPAALLGAPHAFELMTPPPYFRHRHQHPRRFDDGAGAEGQDYDDDAGDDDDDDAGGAAAGGAGQGGRAGRAGVMLLEGDEADAEGEPEDDDLHHHHRHLMGSLEADAQGYLGAQGSAFNEQMMFEERTKATGEEEEEEEEDKAERALMPPIKTEMEWELEGYHALV